MNTQLCKICKEDKEMKYFSKNKDTKNKTDSRCKSCMIKYRKDRRTIEKEKELFKNINNGEYLDKTPPNINNKDWQGGKYKGTVIKREKENAYRASINGYYKQYNIEVHGEKKAKIMAFKWKKEKSDELLETKNKYKIIFDGIKPMYAVVQLSKQFVTIVDYDDLNKIRKLNINLNQKIDNHVTKHAVCTLKGNNILLHRLLMGLVDDYDGKTVVDHINRYSLDNRKENLRITTYNENNKNRNKVKETRLSRNNDTKMYKATIEYSPKIGYCDEIVEYFKLRKDATRWIDDKCREINGYEKLSDLQKRLTESYEKIMKEHANDFIWKDNIREETIQKSNEAAENKINIQNHNKIINGRKDIYDKFLNIDPTIDTFALAKLGAKIVHQTYNNIEYKYCSKCEIWVDVCKYTKLAKNWDNLNKSCKACMAERRINKPNDWNLKNKDKVKEYAKLYRQKNADKINKINEANRVSDTNKLERKNKRRQNFWTKFVQLVENKGATIISTIDDYQTAHSKLKMKCANGSEYVATWNNLSRGKWCKCCK